MRATPATTSSTVTARRPNFIPLEGQAVLQATLFCIRWTRTTRASCSSVLRGASDMEKRLIQRFAQENGAPQRPAARACLLSGALLLFWITGCGSGTTSSTTPPPPTSPHGPQTYLAPFVAGTTSNATTGG